jgi:hypothetical protein
VAIAGDKITGDATLIPAGSTLTFAGVGGATGATGATGQVSFLYALLYGA